MHVLQVPDLVEAGREARLLVHLARGGLQRAFSALDPAGEDLPETAPLGGPPREEDLATAKHDDAHRLQLGRHLESFGLPDG